ncbi:hypothetical protein QE152_g3773 [Popillia japonica]|uniref:Uncharacterized protein n=1 Tax=Popillia japonica TaxID=7064 RepID=A0AAW1N2W8_POPJA
MMLIDWAFLDTYNNVDVAVAAFYTKILSVVDMHVPKRTTLYRKFPVCFSPSVVKLIKLKEYYFRKWKQVSSTRYYEEFWKEYYFRKWKQVSSTRYYEEFWRLRKVIKTESQREYEA